MHKYTIFGLSLVALLFLATTTGKSMQVSASEERYIVDDYTLDYPSVDEDLSYGEDSYSYYDSYGDRYIVDDFNSDYPSVDEDLSYEEDSYSYGDSYGHKYDKYDKEPKEKKFLCKYGPLTGVFVKDKKFCDKKTPPTPEEDAELQCEECIKYWGHTLEQGQFRQFINYFSEWINAINFDFQPVLSSPNNPPQTPCAERLGNNTLVEGDNPNPNVECLPLAFNDLERNLSQVFEICEQLELALEYIASENNISISAAFELFQNGFTAFLGGPACNRSGAEEECDTGIGLLECLEERLLPILEKENQPTMITESGQQDLVQALHQNSMTESLLQQLTPQQQGQSSISQEQMHPQQIVKSQPIQAESTQQQSTQPKGPSSISQEEMHPQQIVKLKQLLESSLPTSPFIYGVPKH
jgi:hypothetical protein